MKQSTRYVAIVNTRKLTGIYFTKLAANSPFCELMQSNLMLRRLEKGTNF